MSEYTEEEYQQQVKSFNELLVKYMLNWSNFFETANAASDSTVSLAEMWFKCPACDEMGGAENMFLLQCSAEDESVVMQSLSTFFDVTEDGNYSGVEAIFDLGASEVVMVCRECVKKDGYDPDSVEIIMPEFTEKKFV